MAPFACLDGVNERGVSIAVLTLDSAPTHQVSGRQHINTALAIRLVLDRAASTQEAVELLARYDMHAMADRDYHFFLNDASGDSRAIEYDPYDPDRPLIDLPVRQMTNFFARYQDMVLQTRRTASWGMARSAKRPSREYSTPTRETRARKSPGKRSRPPRRNPIRKASRATRSGRLSTTTPTGVPR